MNTKEKIQRVAIKMFTGNGYTETSLRQISEELNISKAALYYHFSNKEEIFTSIVKKILKDALEFNKKLSLQDISTWGILKLWMEHSVSLSMKNNYEEQFVRQMMIGKFKQIYNKIDILEFISENFEILNSVIKRGIENREIRDDIDSKFLAMSFLSALHSPMGPMQGNIKNFTKKEIVDNLYAILYDGMKSKENK